MRRGANTASLIMIRSSRVYSSLLTPIAENSANNAWNYNGNNGKLNNNNKINSNSSRPVLELPDEIGFDTLEGYPFPLSRFYQMYRITRKNKSTKPGFLVFNQNYPEQLRWLCWASNTGHYDPRTSTAFVIEKPKIRECVAADAADRVVQTLLVQENLPQLEEYEHPDSYSCRKGKGCLAAIERLHELSMEMSEGGKKSFWVCEIDFKNHFMNIDIVYHLRRFKKFIEDTYPGTPEQKRILKYLSDRIYLHRAQFDCRKISERRKFLKVPFGKSLEDCAPYMGVPIGNVTSQTLSNWLTTPYLFAVEALGVVFVFYTDDTFMFAFSKEVLLKAVEYLRKYAWEECRTIIHPDKFYLQEGRKGFGGLGVRIRGKNITPSKRIVHNFHNCIKFMLKIAKGGGSNLFKYRDYFRDRLNSYLSLMGHFNSYRLRKRGVDEIRKSIWTQIFSFPTNLKKVMIRFGSSLKKYYLCMNRMRRRNSQQLKYALI